MTKPKIYDIWADRAAVLRRLRQRPKYMWFNCGEQGNVRMLQPYLDCHGHGVCGRVEVSPRYVGRVSNV